MPVSPAELQSHAVLVSSRTHRWLVLGDSSAAEDFSFCEGTVEFLEFNYYSQANLVARISSRPSGLEKEDIPIIAFSANLMEGIKRECAAAGMSDFVAKPLVAKGLFQTLASWSP